MTPRALPRLVLDALDTFKVTYNEPLRYTTLVCDMQNEDDNWNLKSRLMLFINELLNVQDIGERIEIRADFLYAGLKDVVDVGRGATRARALTETHVTRAYRRRAAGS